MLPIEDKLAITDLYAAYNRAIDAGDADAWIATFTDDGVFERAAGTFRGPAELRKFVEERNASLADSDAAGQQHWNSNIHTDGEGDRAQGGCYLMLVGRSRSTGQPVVVARGQYTDELHRIDGAWRFHARRVVTD